MDQFKLAEKEKGKPAHLDAFAKRLELHLAPHTLKVLKHEAPRVLDRELLVRVPRARPEALHATEPGEALARRDLERRVDLVREVHVVAVLQRAFPGAVGEVRLELDRFLLRREVGERPGGNGRRVVDARVHHDGLVVGVHPGALGRLVLLLLVPVLVIVVLLVNDPRGLVRTRALRHLLESAGRRSGESGREHLGVS